IHHAILLVQYADALRADDFYGGFGARLTGDGAEHTVEKRHIAPVAGRIARVADGELTAAFVVGLVGHDIVGIGRVVPNPEARRSRVSLVVSLGLTSGRRLGKVRAGSEEHGGEDGSANEQISDSHGLKSPL